MEFHHKRGCTCQYLAQCDCYATAARALGLDSRLSATHRDVDRAKLYAYWRDHVAASNDDDDDDDDEEAERKPKKARCASCSSKIEKSADRYCSACYANRGTSSSAKKDSSAGEKCAKCGNEFLGKESRYCGDCFSKPKSTKKGASAETETDMSKKAAKRAAYGLPPTATKQELRAAKIATLGLRTDATDADIARAEAFGQCTDVGQALRLRKALDMPAGLKRSI